MKKLINKCTFCTRDEKEVTHFFSSKAKEVVICDECIAELHSYGKKSENGTIQHTPKGIFKSLREYVVGQDQAIKELSITLFKHLISFSDKNTGKSLKGNVLMVGPTGCGKTYILDIASKLLSIPVLVVDSTLLTASGYVGDDVEQMLSRLYKKANSSIVKAEKAIVFLDEIDKLAKRESQNGAKDIGGEAVQQELLKIIEGTKLDVNLDNRKPYVGKTINIDTSNILFIAGGAFSGIENILAKQLKTEISPVLSIGVNRQTEDKSIAIRNSLVEFGIIPELAARFSTVALLKKLTYDNIQELLRGNRSRIKNYIDLLHNYNIHIEIEDEVYDLITKYTLQLNTGARGINYVVDRIFSHYLYNIEDYQENSHIKLNCDDAKNIINSF